MAKTVKKRVARREWTNEDLRELKAHSGSKADETNHWCPSTKGISVGHIPWSPKVSVPTR
jgi:hypothetical protein